MSCETAMQGDEQLGAQDMNMQGTRNEESMVHLTSEMQRVRMYSGTGGHASGFSVHKLHARSVTELAWSLNEGVTRSGTPGRQELIRVEFEYHAPRAAPTTRACSQRTAQAAL